MNTLRAHSISNFADIFGRPVTDSIPFNIEKSIYNWTIRKCKSASTTPSWENKVFKEMYKQKIISIAKNLKNEETTLKDRVLAGQVITRTIAQLTPAELFPTGPCAKSIHDQYIKQMNIDLACGRLNANTIGIFKCGRCKSNKTTYYEMQTRSADEPMTAFITCLACGKRWKS
jgi:DNA-directed RNA polymerase subunit M/transcription elongation factor TFIIS